MTCRVNLLDEHVGGDGRASLGQGSHAARGRRVNRGFIGVRFSLSLGPSG
jgi:hypothetical protein